MTRKLATPTKYDCVLEGGGVKIPGLVGAMAAIEEKGMQPDCLAGTSAGSIVAACRAAGYLPEEMKNIITELDFTKFRDGANWGRKTINLLRRKGIYRGDVFYEEMQRLMKDKGILTFGELRNKDEEDPKFAYKFRCFSADLTLGTLVTWPDDAKIYGLDPDFLEVSWAVRTSMSIPYFFWPVRLGGSYFVDGGLLSNFPIWQFDSRGTPSHPTFGIMLEEIGGGVEKEITGPVTFLEALIKTSLSAHDKRFVRPGDFENRTIKVPVRGVKTTDFGITAAKKEELFHSGLTAGRAFFDNWSWADYVKWAKETRRVLD